jgi:hypothetical protein
VLPQAALSLTCGYEDYVPSGLAAPFGSDTRPFIRNPCRNDEYQAAIK